MWRRIAIAGLMFCGAQLSGAAEKVTEDGYWDAFANRPEQAECLESEQLGRLADLTPEERKRRRELCAPATVAAGAPAGPVAQPVQPASAVNIVEAPANSLSPVVAVAGVDRPTTSVLPTTVVSNPTPIPIDTSPINPAPTVKVFDFNNDGVLNNADLQIFQTQLFGTQGPEGLLGDMNCDGVVSTLDLAILLNQINGVGPQ